jgi:membrane protease YdiL (CAAX protease family)
LSQIVTSNIGLVGSRKVRRSLQFALFVGSMLWFALSDALAARAARGISNRFDIDAVQPLLSALFLIFLLVVGFSVLATISRTGGTLRSIFSLPGRATAGAEWALGAAIGWAVAVATVLPMALVRALHVRFWADQRAFSLFALHAATLLFAMLAIEIALRGYPFRRLIEAFGPTGATVTMAVLLAIAHGITPESTWISILVTLIGSILLSLAWLRTHGLWLSWGLHFATSASLAVLFGLPIRGVNSFASVIQTRAVGPAWLTGADFGPEGAFLMALALIGAIVILVRSTDDYAWNYTRREIIAAGYEVAPAPPAEHVAMEQAAAARPPALVQILPTTPQSRSVEEP